ncbi:MAG: hypothetical protein QNL91_01310 [Candidatus Krumholzibacteria bacterium]|nr:hypothetical protein [Candidatus Krumholzibacteria bacterium]
MSDFSQNVEQVVTALTEHMGELNDSLIAVRDLVQTHDRIDGPQAVLPGNIDPSIILFFPGGPGCRIGNPVPGKCHPIPPVFDPSDSFRVADLLEQIEKAFEDYAGAIKRLRIPDEVG